MDPFDKSVKKFIKDAKIHKCSKGLVTLRGQELKMDQTVKKSWKYSGSHCCYRTVTRVNQTPTNYNKDADWGISYSQKCFTIPTNGSFITINSSYVKVECENANKLKTVNDFYAVVLPPEQLSPKAQSKVKKWENVTQGRQQQFPDSVQPDRPPSVVVIGIDSISRLHMIRSLPKTKTFLEDNDFVEMKGYTKIGENTFPNVMGILAGMHSYNYSSCWKNNNYKVDDCPFIWKNFSENGYLTSLVEDSPGLAIFNYAKVGFVEQPVDYYLRPIMTAQHKHLKIDRYSGNSYCIGGELSPTQFLMKYIKDVVAMTAEKKLPAFLFSWFTSVGHDDFNLLKGEDNSFRSLLQDITKNPLYDGDNTVIFFISDHGYRFGSFRETFLGFYEESLPFFFVRIPPKLKSQFLHWYHNLKINSQRLTSPLDFHETLKDILQLSSPFSSTNSTQSLNINSRSSQFNTTSDDEKMEPFREFYSFFDRTPLNRTCESSGIPNQYCMCGVIPELTTSSDELKRLAKLIINEVNQNILVQMIAKKLCQTFKFTKVLYGRLLSQGEVWNNFGKLIPYNMYLVAFEASPGKVRFEAKIKKYENGTELIQGSVNRINSYQGQSDCVDDGFLKKYCFCSKSGSKKPLAGAGDAAKKQKKKRT